MKKIRKNVLQKTEDNLVASRYKPTDKLFENSIIDDGRLLTKQELAVFLNVSIKMIDRKVSMKEIPYLKIGKLVRFSKAKVLAWAEENILKR